MIVCTNGLINRLSLKGPYNSDYEQSLMFLREIRPMEYSSSREKLPLARRVLF